MKLNFLIALFLMLMFALNGNAQLLFHLDASIEATVKTDADGIVTSWIDLSGNTHDALPVSGKAIYPSLKTFDNGLNAIDLRDSSISLQLLSAEESDIILNQEANPTGFCIITAVYIESIVSDDWNDILGNNSTVDSGFFMRYSSSGKLQVNLNGIKQNGSEIIESGQAAIFSFNYDAVNSNFKFWCSATDEELINTVSPADFSNDSPLAIGSTNRTNRYFDGMLGEVLVYNTSLTKEELDAKILELSEKWGLDAPEDPEEPVTSTSNVKIVQTKYSNSDVAIIAFDASEAPYNADKTGATDASKAIQNALDDCEKALGGVVYLPEGTYRIEGSLTFGDGVILRGDWKEPTENDKTVAGTVLNIYAGKGVDSEGVSTKSPFELGSSGGIRDLTIFYPEQDAANPVAYPFTVSCRGKLQTVLNVTLVNSYRGIRYENLPSVGHPYAHNVYGYPLKKGIRLNHAVAVPRIDGIHFAPSYWAESGLPGAPSEQDALNAGRSLESVAIELLHSDNGIIGNTHIKGYDVAIQFMEANDEKGGASNMKVYDIEISECRVGINALGLKSQGWTFTKGNIQVDGDDALAVSLAAQGILTFNDVAFSSTGKLIKSTMGRLSFTNCRFVDWQDDSAITMADDHLISYGNIFSKALADGQSHIYLGSGVDAAAISGNTFENSPAKIVSLNTNKNVIVIDTTETYEVYRHNYESHPSPKYFKPAKLDTLFNVQNYGAVGDMETENSAAFKAALKAAEQNGGGTVYVPGGAYRINKSLVIPTGVELRGIHDLPVYTGHGRSILLSYIEDKSNPGDSAFVTMQQGSGIRGLVLIRPEQVFNDQDASIGTTIQDWPFAIRAVGDNCSIVNIDIANADKGIDLASVGGGHYVNWYMTAPLRLCINIETGTNPIIVDNMQTNPGLFRDIKGTMDWSLFTNNASLKQHFEDNIAPLASESRSLYPNGTAANVTGNGKIDFYSNFYNSPFEGFIINGSPKMTTFMSGGEGENFYQVRSEGTGGIELTIIANTYHPIGDEMDKAGFGSYQLNPGSSGIVKVLNTTSFGAPDIGYRINNGKLIVQSAFQTVSLKTWVEARGDASASIEGCYMYRGNSDYHGVAFDETASVGFYGTFSSNSYKVLGDVDVSGSTPQSVTVVDNTNPTAPLNLQAQAISSSQIVLTWNASTDNVNVAGYYIYRNGAKVGQVTNTTYENTGLSPETSYEYYVIAYDAASNASEPSNTISISTLPVGVEGLNVSSNALTVYPNPSKGQVLFSLPNASNAEMNISVYATNGVKVMAHQHVPTANSAELKLDVSHLNDGLYFYRISSVETIYTGKFQVQKK